jgi:hypothetical protein
MPGQVELLEEMYQAFLGAKMNRQTKCKLCGVDIRHYDEGECDNCHHVRHVIECNPAVALKVLQELREKESTVEHGQAKCSVCGRVDSNHLLDKRHKIG